jgi:SPP1 gp7 family putative phage head morphogenesis protein
MSERLLEMQLRLRQRTTGRKRRRRKRKPPRFPAGPVVEYRRLLREVIDMTLRVMELELGRTDVVRQDAIQDDLVALFERIKGRATTLLSSVRFRERLTEILERTDRHAALEIQKDVSRALGIDVITSVPGRADKIGGYVAENVALVNGLQESMIGSVRDEIMRAVSDGTNTADLANSIANRARISKNRAKLIARDQIGKVNGALMRERHASIGVTKYRWRSSQDERVRNSHAARNGEVFSWDAPPSDGHPGQPINCRCTAEAVFNFDGD